MLLQLIDTLYNKVQVSLKSLTPPSLDWNTLFASRRNVQKKTLKYSGSPEACDDRLNATSRKREIPARCPRG